MTNVLIRLKDEYVNTLHCNSDPLVTGKKPFHKRVNWVLSQQR